MDSETKALIGSLLFKYMNQFNRTREGLMLDPSDAVNWIKENLKVNHQIEVPNLTLKIFRILAEEEFNQ